MGSEFALDSEALEKLCLRLDDGIPPHPLAFAHYYSLVFAIEADDQQQARLFSEKLSAVAVMPENEIVALGPELGEECSALYAYMVEADEQSRLDIAAPSAADAARFREGFAQAIALIKSAVPLLAEEIDNLARQIIMVSQGKNAEAEFDGGSHFQLWNALFLNISRPRSRIALAEVIAHECAHSLLFGYCTDEPLVLNDDDERYASPLRDDPRPMDGIYHATFVSARMCWLLESLIGSGLLENDEMAEAAQSVERDRRNFADGENIISEHGSLTETGRQVLDGARDYMTQRGMNRTEPRELAQ